MEARCEGHRGEAVDVENRLPSGGNDTASLWYIHGVTGRDALRFMLVVWGMGCVGGRSAASQEAAVPTPSVEAPAAVGEASFEVGPVQLNEATRLKVPVAASWVAVDGERKPVAYTVLRRTGDELSLIHISEPTRPY